MLQAEHLHLLRRRPDKYDAPFAAGSGESGILAEKAVARMNRFRAGVDRGLQDALRIQVAFLCRTGTDKHGGICEIDMQTVLIGLRIDGNGFYAQLTERPLDPHGNGAAVRNEY